MIYITVAVLFLMLIISVIKERNVYNPLTLFLALWLFVCFLASLLLFNMNPYSDHAPLVILIGVLGYCFGYGFGRKTRIKIRNQIPIIGFDDSKEYVIRENLLIVLLIIALIVYVIMAISVVGLLAIGYSASTIRELYRDSGETAISGLASSLIYGSKLLKQMDSYIAQPVVLASIPLMSIDIAEKGKITKVVALSIVTIGLSMFVNFGRNNIPMIILSVACAFFIKRKQLSRKAKRRVKYAAFVMLIAAVVFFMYLTNARSSGLNPDSLQNIYAYFSIPVPLLDYWIDQVNAANAYSLGFSYISGFVANIMNVLARFNIIIEPYKISELYNYNLVDHFIRVFPLYEYNAYVSIFFAFYLDFREFGVLVGSLLYGYIISGVYNKAKTSNVYLAFYLLLLQSILWSIVRWDFVIVAYCFSFILLRALYKKENH